MQPYSKIIQTAGLIVIKEGRLLLAYSRHKKAWYLPGGKLGPEESSLEALFREVKEELSVELKPEDVKAYYHISAPAYGEPGTLMEQHCFLGPSHLNYKASQEIDAIHYFNKATYLNQQPIVPGVITAFDKLIQDGYLS